jgi:protein TonB
MPQDPLQDVFTADELARAVGVPRAAIDALVTRGDLRPIAGMPFFTAHHAVAAGRRLRAAPPDVPPLAPAPLFSPRQERTPFADGRGIPAFASSFVHGAILLALLVLTSGATETATTVVPDDDETHLVFLVTPGPGGGGGGGGVRNPLPTPRVERRGAQRSRVTVPDVEPEAVLASRRVPEPPRPSPPPAPQPKPDERAPEPLPSQVLVAPVAPAAANERNRAGVVETPRGTQESQGAGAGGGAGEGRGTGNGEGLGSGIGDGAGGGTGGGPFRPGSGIEPPRLLREIKAEYTDEARRRNLTGDVLLEIVVRRDGTVGDVTVLQGLGGGLDQRAVAAVRQWQFSAARRRGEPVDVLVEVAVEFTLR